MKTRTFLTLGGVVAGAALVGVLASLYAKDARAVRARSRAESRMLNTRVGPVECRLEGAGATTLVLLHGAGGSYRHGLLLARMVQALPVRVVAFSRPGYHATSLERGRSMTAQADMVAAILDELQIERAVVMGISAGGPPAIQFAVRHAERCDGLVLLSAINPGIKVFAPTFTQTALIAFLKAVLSFDFPLWLALKFAERPVCELNGWAPRDAGDWRAWEIIEGVVRDLVPTRLWRDGALNDIEQVFSGDNATLEQIKVPTLVIHGTQDLQAPYTLGQYAARTIAGAKLMTIEGGSHLIMGTHWREIVARLEAFVSA